MEFIDIAKQLGESPESPALLAHFREFGVTQQPRIKEGDLAAFVQFPEQGYEMRFDQAKDGIHTYLFSLSAYPAGNATHSRFLGQLPLGILASDTRDQLIARLGEPVLHNKIFKIDQWRDGDHDVAVSYDKATGSIKLVQAYLRAG